MLGLYLPTESVLHRVPSGYKILSLIIAGMALFLFIEIHWLIIALFVTVILYAVAKISWREALKQIRPTFTLLFIIFVAQAIIDHWITGFLIVLRFVILIMLASLVTLTTRVSEMVEAIERGLKPLSYIGINPAKVGLAISMAIRFIPVLAQQFNDVREAQKARGLGLSIRAIAVPLIVRMLKMANDISEALDARSYDPDFESPNKKTGCKNINPKDDNLMI